MKKYLFAKIMVNSPNTLEIGQEFARSISSHLSKQCDVNIVSIKRYYKIEEYVKVEIEFFPYKTNEEKQNILLFFSKIIQTMGNNWSLRGTDKEPEAVWNEGENNWFFQEEARWVYIETRCNR